LCGATIVGAFSQDFPLPAKRLGQRSAGRLQPDWSYSKFACLSFFAEPKE
jgi:hypothetical protein